MHVPTTLNVTPIEQRWQLLPVDLNGERAALLLITSPMCTQAVALTREAALALADALRERFGALTIVTDLPGTAPSDNGQGPP